MDFNFSEEQLAVKDVVDRMFTDLCDDERIKREYASSRPMHRELWQQLADGGLLGASLPESVGGSDLGFTETCLVIEAQGRCVAPLPLVETVVECALTLARHATPEIQQRLLPGICRGELLMTCLRPYRGLMDRVPLQARAAGNGWSLHGSSACAPSAPLADEFLVCSEDADGTPLVLLLAAETAGMELTEQTLIGGICAATAVFDGAAVPAERVVAAGDAARDLLADQRRLTMTALAAQQVGVLTEGLARTARYDNERKQFGRPLSSFQAVAHQAADAYMAIEALRGVYWRALDDIDRGRDDDGLSAHVAKYWLCRSGHLVGHTVMHLHGGMGQDLEYPIHRFFTWAKKNERYLGPAPLHSSALGALIAGDPASAMSLPD